MEYADTAPTANSLIVVNESNGKSKVIDYYDIYEMDYSSYYSSGSASYTGYDCEGQLDSAISYVQSDDVYTIYQIEGHDEAVLDSTNFGTSETLTEMIEKYNCEVASLNLLSVEEISTDECAALLILGPTKDYSKEDAQKVIDYLNKGGKAIIGLENITSEGTYKSNFNKILEEFNIKIESGVVAENDSAYYSGQQGPWFAFQEGITGYAAELTSYVFAPYTAGMSVLDENNTDVTYTALASTTESSVLKTDLEKATTYEKEDGDEEGPFDTVVTASKTISESVTSDVLVFGSVYSLSDTMDSVVSQSNTQIVNNALKDYIDSDVEMVSVPSKSLQSESLTVTESGSRLFGILLAVVAPVVILASGIVVWVRRRKR